MAKMHERFIVDSNGKKTAVVVPLRSYRRMLEDIHDLTIVAERRGEPTVTLGEVKRKLRADGLLPD